MKWVWYKYKSRTLNKVFLSSFQILDNPNEVHTHHRQLLLVGKTQNTHTVWYTNQIILYAYTVFVFEPFNYRAEIAAIYNCKR